MTHDDARCTLADVRGYLLKASDLVAGIDPGFAADLLRAAKRAENAAGPHVIAKFHSTAKTSAEKLATKLRGAAAVATRRLANGGRDGR